ncbi:ATP-grasp domain-containing protein [Streptomyces sp. NBC_01235]|uniref:ATP-grasp domain-containing protein n=1 Tax=Streptomyces sp. NBC_01235 TaxID=2903788 RepID=UPI002E11DB54|nr:hypothetical protein OG289_47260 [Streptomyces sp. NBC_01235]
MASKEHVVHVGFADQDAAVIDFEKYDVTLLLDAFAASRLPEDVRRRFARVGILALPRRVDLDDYDRASEQMIALVREFSRDLGEPSAIVGLYENTTLPAARLREEFGLPGTDVRTTLLFRDKVLMKQALNGVVRVPRYWDVDAATPTAELEDIAAGLPGKVVLKPRSQAASFGIEIFDSAGDFLRYARTEGIRDHYEVEEFVEGAVCHFDGLMRDGEILFLSAARYLGNCFDLQYGKEALASVCIDDPVQVRQIHEFTERVLGTLGLRDGSFHLEAFRTPDGDLVFLEVANRLGGGYIRRHFQEAYGLDLLAESIAVCMNLPSAVEKATTHLDLRAAGRGVTGWVHPALQEDALCQVKRIRGLDVCPDSVIYSEIPDIGKVFNRVPGFFVGSGLFILAGETTESIERDALGIIESYGIEVQLLDGSAVLTGPADR